MRSTGRILTYACVLSLLLSLSSPLFVKNALATQTSQAILNPTDDAFIDSNNPDLNQGFSNYLKVLAYSAYYGYSSGTIQSWLKFSLTSIPPAATITNAVLTLRLSYTIVYQNVGVSSESVNSWTEDTITWNSAPRNYVSLSYTDINYVTNSTTLYNWNVQSLVTNGFSAGVVSFVLQPTSTQGISNGWAVFFSKDQSGSPKPTLTVTYSYVSASLSLSNNSISFGSYVSIVGSTDPAQLGGAITLQYSTDQVTWSVIASQNGGMYSISWRPPAQGTYYLRASWVFTWSGGTYTATSGALTLLVSGAASVLTLNVPLSASLNQTLTVIAMLRDSANAPIPGAPIFFTIGSSLIGTKVTDSSGLASITYKLVQTAGSYTISASYTGSGNYSSSSAHSVLVISPWRLVITSAAAKATLLNFNGKNYTTDSSGKLLVPVNVTGTYPVHINSPLLTGAGSRVLFVMWGDGSASPSRTVTVGADLSLSVVTRQQYFLTLQSAYGKPLGTGWYDSGSKASFSVQASIDQGNGTRRLFTGWVRNGQPFVTLANGSLDMNSAANLVANWKKQYNLNIVSPYGNPTGAGWYDPGASVTISVTSPFSKSNDTRYIATGFLGSGSAPQGGTGTSVSFTLNAPGSLTFNWKTQYFLRVVNQIGSASGEGWYDSGATATVSVNQTAVSVNPFDTKRFGGWSGDSNLASASIVLTMDTPKRVVAVWADDLTNAYLSAGGAIAVAAVLIYLFRTHAAAVAKLGSIRSSQPARVAVSRRKLWRRPSQ